MSDATPRRRRLVVANPAADVYGSDLQMLESVSGAIERGWDVTVVTPEGGPLLDMIGSRGAEVASADYPVLRRADASLAGMARLAIAGGRSIVRLRRLLKQLDADVLYVNTVTLPWWILGGRLAGVPVVCHVHEAEEKDSAIVRLALNSPLLAANALIVISTPAMRATTGLLPMLRRRARLIYNGVPDHAEVKPRLDWTMRPFRVVCVARLSPRKGTDVAVEAIATLRRRGHDVVLDLCGTAFAGYEWFVEQLEQRASQPDLAGAVTFSGYVSPVGEALHRAHVAIAPSLREPFGNAVVEAQLAERPIVASAAMGHLETVQHLETGMLVEPGSSDALADAIERLIDDEQLADRLAVAGRERSSREYSVERYHRQVADLLDELVERRHNAWWRRVLRRPRRR